jgi:hypothetical protein
MTSKFWGVGPSKFWNPEPSITLHLYGARARPVPLWPHKSVDYIHQIDIFPSTTIFTLVMFFIVNIKIMSMGFPFIVKLQKNNVGLNAFLVSSILIYLNFWPLYFKNLLFRPNILKINIFYGRPFILMMIKKYFSHVISLYIFLMIN